MHALNVFVILSGVRRVSGGRSRRTCFSHSTHDSGCPILSEAEGCRHWLAVVVLAMAFTPILHAQQPSTSPADAKKDPILSAMLAELDRSKQHLQLDGFEKPYFIEYRLDDEIEYEATPPGER